MATRVVTKIGDVFEVKIDDNKVKYFQLIAYDLLQLNSDVIRCFRGIHDENHLPNLESIIESEVELYVHCVTKYGVKMNLWTKIGNHKNIGQLDKIIFRDTNDYGIKEGEEPISVSNNWHIWKLGDENFNRVGKITSSLRDSHIGLVYNPLSVVDIIKGKKMPPRYPDFE